MINDKVREEGYKAVSLLSLYILCILMMLQVVMRVIFLRPLIGAEEIVRYCLIIIVMIGNPYAIRTGAQVRMEEIQSLLPGFIRPLIRVISLLSGLIIYGFLFYASVFTTVRNIGNTTSTLSIPFWIFFLPTIIGFFFMTVESTVRLVEYFRPEE